MRAAILRRLHGELRLGALRLGDLLTVGPESKQRL
jgi:hypothetical protein